MIRLKLALLCLVSLLATPLAAAWAQAPLAPTVTATTPATPAASTATITPEQARQALDVLNDPAKRAAITTTLEAIAHVQPAAPGPTATISGIPLTPDSLGAAVLVGAANFMNEVGGRISETVHAARGLPALWLWLDTMATDPVARMLLIDLAWRLALALAVSAAALWWIGHALRRPLRLVGRRLIRLPPVVGAFGPPGEPSWDPEDTAQARAERGEIEPALPRRPTLPLLLRRAPLGLARAALELVPVLGFVVVGHVIVGSQLGGANLVRLVLLAVIDSIALYVAALRLARVLLAARHRRQRLLPVPDHTAVYAMRWLRRLLAVGVFGYAATEVGLLLGLSQVAHLALLKTVALVLLICIASIVVHKRRVVRGWIRPPADAQGIVARARDGIAAIWHWIALFYLVSVWLVWAAALPAGYERLSRALLIIIAVVVLARVATRACVSTLERMLQAGTELAPSYPGLDDRLSFYQPFLRLFVKIGVFFAALLLLLQLLGFGTFEWLVGSPLGQHIAGSLTTLAITFLLALGAWEAVNATFERHLARLTRQAQIAKIARLRTLLPILRTTLLIAVVTVTALVVLSEIGVNTAPLLASAGIIGVAIGFGSQKVVQDLITGVFLLLDNTMQVGDVVSVAGLSGVVEHLSVRTIRLRAEDGSVHVIPFSSVTTVTNMTRDYGRAVVQVGIAYKENVDRVIDVLKGVVVEMRADLQWKEVILGDLEVYGLDQFAASAVIIKGRIMCTPFARWSVAREFNRRMKARFDKLGIEMPLPHQKLILDQPLTIHHTAEAVATHVEELS